MGAATVVTGVLAQLKEFFNIQVPGFQIGADGAFALATLINCNRSVIHDLQEWHNALALTVGAGDVRTEGAHWCPVIAQSASPFRQHGVVANGRVNAKQIIWYRGKKAG